MSALLATLNSLYESAIDESVSYRDIEEGVDTLKSLNRAELFQVAADFGICYRLTTKIEAVDAIRRRISERKESAERIKFR